MPFILGTNSIKDTGYNVANSCRFNDGSSDHMLKTASAGNRRTFTFSTWLKLSQLTTARYLFTSWSANNDAGFTYLAITDGDKIKFAGYGTTYLETNQLLRDPSSWYHLMLAVDTTNGTANNRCRIYLNGSEITSFGTRNNPSENADLAYNQNSVDLVLGSNNYGGSKGNYFDGYLAETVLIDGSQLAADSFGEFDSDSPTIWKPIDVSGLTFGTNGFYLDYEASGNLGNDANGGTDLTEANLTAVDQSTDTCTNNFNTMNPLNRFQYNFTFSEGNLKLANSDNNFFGASGTIAINKGKWFFEAKYTGSSNLQHFFVGFTGIEAQNAGDATRNSVAFYNNDGGEIHVSDVSNNAATTANYGTFAQNDIIGVALDYDNELISFYKNGSAIVTNFDFGATTYPSGLTDGKFISPFIGHYASSDIALNFGSPPYSESGGNSDGNGYGNFSMSVPSGYFALCSKKLSGVWIMAYTTIDNPGGEYFNTVLYTGNNGAQTVTGVGFQPDWVWIKDRDGTERHCLTDSVRGVLKELRSNETAAESDRSAGDSGVAGVSAFNSDGFVLVHDDGYNDNNSSQVSWNWKAGTAFSNDASSTGVGSIDSAGSVSTDAGFSILTWTVPASGSATVAHGLGKVPKTIISKSRSNATDWEVYHHKTGNANTNQLNTNAAANDNNAYNDTDPTSSVFSVTASGFGANRTMVSYCFAEVKGYSKFGSYTGNGNADGTFVYTGFKPAWVMIKGSSVAESWLMFDTKRNTYNGIDGQVLRADLNNAEVSSSAVKLEFLSNGFKWRSTDAGHNGSGSSYIYLAFAESPFVNSKGIPNNAR